MTYLVRVEPDHGLVGLPNGFVYLGPSDVELTDSEFAEIVEPLFAEGYVTEVSYTPGGEEGGPPGVSGTTIRHGIGVPATGIPPLDGVHDPWRPIDNFGDWLGQPFAVSWEAGATFTSPADQPAGGQYFFWTVADAGPWNVWWKSSSSDFTVAGTGVIALGFSTQDYSPPSDLTYDTPAAIANCTGFTIIEPYEFDAYQNLPGNEGDYYMDEQNPADRYLYGPLTAGDWGSGVRLRGLDGLDGQQGEPGEAPPSGIGHHVQYNNDTDDFLFGWGEVRELVAEDYQPDDGEFVPDEGNLVPLMASDGTFTFLEGATLLVTTRVVATFDTPPETNRSISTVMQSASPNKPLPYSVNGHDEQGVSWTDNGVGNDEATTLVQHRVIALAVPSGGVIGPLRIQNDTPLDGTFTELDLEITLT